MSEVRAEAEVVAEPDALPPGSEKKADSESGLMSALQSLATTIVIAVFVITFVVQAFQIPSESMEKTLLIGDYLLVDKAHYGQLRNLGMADYLIAASIARTSSSFAIR